MLRDQDRERLIASLRSIVGRQHVLTGAGATRRYRRGFRTGEGNALAVVRPGSLKQQWLVLKQCVAANVIVITQAANTSLTGGATPDGDGYDRDVVIVSTLRVSAVYVIRAGRQVICFPGATLQQLEKQLQPFGREPHSVLGSSCIGASVIGGICNNSGGALVQRGPAYTQLALFARVDEGHRLVLVNHLGVRLGEEPDEVLDRLDRAAFSETDIDDGAGAGSDSTYPQHVRDIDSPTPARYNSDPRLLHEASGSAGKVMVFAVRLDTFPAEADTRVFYIGTNQQCVLTAVRRHILRHFKVLPISGEYLHRSAFDLAERYGKDVFLLIKYLGSKWLPTLFALKNRLDAFLGNLKFLPADPSDRLLQALAGLWPNHLPRRLREYRDEFEHHLILKVSASAAQEARDFLTRHFADAEGRFFECDSREGSASLLHRFTVAGAVVRFRVMNPDQVEGIVALDFALRRNEAAWFETVPEDLDAQLLKKIYYGHFLCHVFHQDYLVRRGQDRHDVEHRLHRLLDERHAEYPAEHNVGHLYTAKPSQREFHRSLDPCNCFNAGIGHTSKRLNYAKIAE